MKFFYRRYEASPTPASGEEEGAIYRPVIPFTLAGPAGELDFFALLDTGADETYVTRQMADRLGLVVDEKWEGKIESASGEMPVHYGEATIEVTDGIEIYRWNVVVGVIDQEWGEAILGHAGFLEFFDVLFRGQSHEIDVARNEAVLPRADR